MSQEDIQDFNERKKNVEVDMKKQVQLITEKKQQLDILKLRLKNVSVDDEKEPSQFKLDTYKKDFINHKET